MSRAPHPVQEDPELANRFRAALREHDPKFIDEFLRELHARGLIQGWRSVLRVRIDMKDIT